MYVVVCNKDTDLSNVESYEDLPEGCWSDGNTSMYYNL